MANEIRTTSHGEVGATDTDDFVIDVRDDTGAVQFTVLRVPVTGSQACSPSTLTAAGSANLILPGVTNVAVGANVNGTSDWVTLPSLSSVPVGHTITIVANAAGHKVRTPATSNEKINNVDSDGSQSYTIASGSQVHIFRKIDNTIGWVGQGFTALGAVVTAIVPAQHCFC